MVIAYNLPDNSSSLSVSHQYTTLIPKEHDNTTVSLLKWSPDYRMLCVLYENGNFCLFSVFGSLLYNSKDLL